MNFDISEWDGVSFLSSDDVNVAVGDDLDSWISHFQNNLHDGHRNSNIVTPSMCKNDPINISSVYRACGGVHDGSILPPATSDNNISVSQAYYYTLFMWLFTVNIHYGAITKTLFSRF